MDNISDLGLEAKRRLRGSVRISVSLERDIYLKLKQIAQETEVSQSKMAAVLIKEGVNELLRGD